jgi:hypothetical protein
LISLSCDGPRELKPATTSPGFAAVCGEYSNFACAAPGCAFAKATMFSPSVRRRNHDGIVTSAACAPGPIVIRASPPAAEL